MCLCKFNSVVHESSSTSMVNSSNHLESLMEGKMQDLGSLLSSSSQTVISSSSTSTVQESVESQEARLPEMEDERREGGEAVQHRREQQFTDMENKVEPADRMEKQKDEDFKQEILHDLKSSMCKLQCTTVTCNRGLLCGRAWPHLTFIS